MIKTPKNILSYPVGTVFSGKEIKGWITYHTTNNTSHTKQAHQLIRFLNIDDDERYIMTKGTCMGSLNQYLFIKTEKKNKNANTKIQNSSYLLRQRNEGRGNKKQN